MRHSRYLPYCLVVLTFLSACGPKLLTKGEAFPKVYEEEPLAVLVVPPINESTAADAGDYYLTTIAEPLAMAGYYVFPCEVVQNVLRQEGLPDAALIVELPLEKFAKYFGADAVLFTRIVKWDTSYYVLGGNVVVGVDFVMKSTKTGELLWQYHDELKVDTTGDNAGLPGLAGLIVKAVSTAVNTATTDYVPIARKVNYMALASLPHGEYSPTYGRDRDQKSVFAKKMKIREQ